MAHARSSPSCWRGQFQVGLWPMATYVYVCMRACTDMVSNMAGMLAPVDLIVGPAELDGSGSSAARTAAALAMSLVWLAGVEEKKKKKNAFHDPSPTPSQGQRASGRVSSGTARPSGTATKKRRSLHASQTAVVGGTSNVSMVLLLGLGRFGAVAIGLAARPASASS